ncbi:MAG: hypothetical protein ACI8UR_001576, partial [Natronomonas sp.]
PNATKTTFVGLLALYGGEDVNTESFLGISGSIKYA